MQSVIGWFTKALARKEAKRSVRSDLSLSADNAASKSNKNIAVQTHKKLDNVTLNMYYRFVSAQAILHRASRRQ
jgi:hypothetical protein